MDLFEYFRALKEEAKREAERQAQVIFQYTFNFLGG